MPFHKDKKFFAQFRGYCDDVASGARNTGGNPLLLNVLSTDQKKSVDMRYLNREEDIFLAQGWLGWENAGWGDSVSYSVMAEATPVAPQAGGDYSLDGDRLLYSPGGGTHAIAGNVTLVTSRFRRGYWDLNNDGGLTPNPAQKGKFDIFTREVLVEQYVDRFLVYGSSGLMSITGDNVARVPPGYFVRVTANNESGTDWKVWGNLLFYREKTA
jgi:hypothetical protein